MIRKALKKFLGLFKKHKSKTETQWETCVVEIARNQNKGETK